MGTGYSGNGLGLNNPAMQDVRDVGPIPIGQYNIGPGYTHRILGRVTMNLNPLKGTNTFGRTLFRIHGDSPDLDNSASKGCIVTGPAIRNLINHSDDRILDVMP